MRAVVVDDEEDMRQLVRLLLELDGVEVVGEAADTWSAVRCWREVRPDVVVLDHRMPGASGLDAAERILGEDPSTKILLFSAYLDSATTGRADALGVHACIPKDQVRRIPALVKGDAA